MIDHLDNLLRNMLLGPQTGLTDPLQIRFEPPDEDWRTWVSGLPAGSLALNIYLADLRENRKLRTNFRDHRPENGFILETPAPTRVECHYLITAWSQATAAPAIEPPIDEHRLLHDVLAVLMNSAPLNPSRIYPPASTALTNVPEIIRNADLPTQILPVEGFAKLAEFWGAMGTNHRWKPAIYLIVTLPVVLTTEVSGPMVTSLITEYMVTGHPEASDIWIQIGGQVVDASGTQPEPLPNAWVGLLDTQGDLLQSTQTNALGRFIFGNLRPGDYQLQWSAIGFTPQPAQAITVPSPTGEYDLIFN